MIALFLISLLTTGGTLLGSEFPKSNELSYMVYIGLAKGEMTVAWQTQPDSNAIQIKGGFKLPGLEFPHAIQSTVDAKLFTAQRAVQIGKENTAIYFDQEKHVVVYPDTQMVIPEKTYDLLGLFLVLQTIDPDSLPQNKWLHLNKENYRVTISKKGKENIRNRKGKYQHLVLSVQRPKKSNLDISVWLSPNPHVPVRFKMQTRILKDILPVTITADLNQEDP